MKTSFINLSRLSGVLLLFTFCQSVSAQKNQSVFTASISSGAAIPVGNFASTVPDTTNLHGGANSGPVFQVSFGYRFRNMPFGISLSGSIQRNNHENNGLRQSLQELYPNMNQIIINGKSWTVYKLLAGPVWYVPVSKTGRWRAELSLTGGFLKTSIPGFTYSVSSGDLYSSFYATGTQTPRSLNAAFCYQGGVTLGYRIAPAMLLTAATSYSHAVPHDKYTRFYFPTPSSPPQMYDVDQKIPVSTLNLLLGLSFEF